jgi:peptide/nickel transport system ATP-binding protein
VPGAVAAEEPAAPGGPPDLAPLPLHAPALAPAAVLRVERLRKFYNVSGALARWLGLAAPPVRAVDDVSFEMAPDEILALVGESGCGKTTLGRVVVRLLRPTGGAVRFFVRATGTEVTDGRTFRRAVQIVFQHPDASLNPMKRVRRILERSLALAGVPAAGRRERSRELLAAVRLDPRHLDRLPAELSGGEKQRVAIARALALRPELVVLDEPVSALDVSTQASIVRLLVGLRRELGAAYLFISHDLGLVRHVAGRVGVMYLGRLVELGSVEDVFAPPSHPYTRALLSAIPVPDPTAPGAALRLEGAVPSAQRPPAGCRFHTRCPVKLGPVCEEAEPPLRAAGPGHWIACHIPLETLRREHPFGATGRR